MIRILIVEDDADFAFLIKNTVNSQPDMEAVGIAVNSKEALKFTELLLPDIVLMDLSLSESKLDGIDAARSIRLQTSIKLLILTAFEDPAIILDACRRSFAFGYVFKSQFDLLVETIRKTMEGPTPQEYMIQALILSALSPAEQSVLNLLLGKEQDLHSSPKTIYNQKASILKKLHLKNQEELIHIFQTYHRQ